MMTTLSVVHYNSSPHKLNVLQPTATNANERREIIILRKTSNKDDILITNTAASKKKSKTCKDAKTGHPQPLAVARRNARERNRVKQVNNGFANLRQHIPNCIAAAFESGRNGNKKLSKVETLRMAVEYIRSLEELLATDETSDNANSSSSSFPSPSPSSPAVSSNPTTTYSYPLLSPSGDEDDLSTNPTPPPHYIRINNSYQVMSNHLYDDSENLEPIHVDQPLFSDPTLIEFNGVQDLSILNNESLSPDMYSEQSLSPDFVDDDVHIKLEHNLPIISLKNDEQIGQPPQTSPIDMIQWWEEQQCKQQLNS